MSYELHFGLYFILNAFQGKKEESGPGAGSMWRNRICGQWYDKTETDSKEQQQDNTEKDDNKEIREQETDGWGRSLKYAQGLIMLTRYK